MIFFWLFLEFCFWVRLWFGVCLVVVVDVKGDFSMLVVVVFRLLLDFFNLVVASKPMSVAKKTKKLQR